MGTLVAQLADARRRRPLELHGCALHRLRVLEADADGGCDCRADVSPEDLAALRLFGVDVAGAEPW
jgi:hypothetical protein